MNLNTANTDIPLHLDTDGQKLRVLQVGKFYPPHMGGIETHLQALSEQLSKSVDLQVLVASDNSSGSEEVLEGVAVSRVPTRLTVSSAPVCPGMIRKISRSNADIIHIHLPNPTAVLAYLASRNPAHLVITYHSDTVRQKFLGALFEPCLHAALRRSSAIIVSSPNYPQSSDVLRHYRDRCHPIPFGIRLAEFEQCDPAAVSAIRKQYGDRLVLSVGRLVYYKGFEYLIRAMTQVRGKLLIIGDGTLRGKLEDLARSIGVENKVHFLGNVPGSLRSYYQAVDVFTLASIARSEAFGIVQIEALASGLPVVNTNLDSGVPFVSLDGETGFTVPPCDPDALACAINRLLEEQDLRRSFSSAARQRARTEFSLERMTSRTLALYGTVMHSGK
jgi:glycosyltransferase involved in cell wall biosynthesis